MKNNEDELYTVDELVKKTAEKLEKVENQFVVVLNKGTSDERVLDVYESEVEANKVKEGSRSKVDVIKANVTFAFMNGLKYFYGYEEVEH